MRVCNISICPACGSKEAIEDFVVNGSSSGLDSVITVPKGKNGTGFPSEPVEDEGEECEKKEKLKIDVLPTSEWYITKIWTGREVEVAR